MARRSSSAALFAACFARLALQVLLPSSKQPVSFVPPQRLRDGLAGGLAAGVLAASVLGPLPADAATAKFSVFGFGDGVSDAYQQIDADAISPYSQFSNPKDAIYKKGDDFYVQKKKTQLADSFKRLEKIPGFIQAKNKEDIKSILTLQLYTMRANMEYLSGTKDSAPWKKAREFFQDVADVGVLTLQANWEGASVAYGKATSDLGEWKGLVAY